MAMSLNSLSSKSIMLMLLLLTAVSVNKPMAAAQTSGCTAELTNLDVCAPFVVPGAANTNPSAECCTALQTVEHECLCNTVRVASRLPALCNAPIVSCPT